MAEKAVERRRDDVGDYAPPEQEIGGSNDEQSEADDSLENIPGKPMSDMAPPGQDGAEDNL